MTDMTVPDALIRAVVFSLVALVWVIALVRVAGVRSLSKMTAFDFVVTLATGSLLANASAASGWVTFVQSVAALTVLMAAQVGLAFARRTRAVRRMIENEPLLLMRNGAFLDDALRKGRVTHEDLRAKLRQANIADPRAVAFMVLETTGDIAILTHTDLGEEMMAGVRGG
ncbi:DUF421 domain-containing protein [Sphingomonas oligophenolica]|uniref:DUF421 domain-containing protein n=1 Tax=Sphingomonas oligophenolica TaxID=301154 RepID=A0A502CBA6_9SPHN|nr:YetF domain-containing protein [Sphingomonas oligophenolica]TPG10022.1 DUF421 domain-containing protein [Sphingomonas oligophenolica]